MAVNEIKQSAESKTQEGKDVEEKANDLMDGVFKTLDLPEDVPEDKPKGEPVDPVEAEDDDDDEDIDGEGDDATYDDEDDDDVEDDADGPDEVDEEVVPKSKLDKITKKTNRRIAQQAQRIRELEAKLESSAKPTDPDQEKLDKMDETELKSLRRQVVKARAKVSRDTTLTNDEAEKKLDDLLDLEDKIESTLSGAPQKFQETQIQLYNAKAQEILDGEDELSDESIKFIRAKAAAIYNRKGNEIFQKSKYGQAEALQLAYEHFCELRKATTSKSGDKDLRRKVNRLKRKTSLDVSGAKKAANSKRLKRLREKAFRGGDAYDKENLIKTDPAFNIDGLIPDEYKE